jgi:hypothetical protein
MKFLHFVLYCNRLTVLCPNTSRKTEKRLEKERERERKKERKKEREREVKG